MESTQSQADAMMHAKPQKEHEWLQKLVGEWTYESEAEMEPGKPPTKFTGTERVRTLGGLWFIAEGESEAPEGTHQTVMTLGYDTEKRRYVGTWIGSMMAYMWVYDGEVDPAGKVLTLDTVGPSMTGDGKTAQYRETIEFKSDDHRVFASHVQTENGKWQLLMTATYRRR